jgi:hypothetical protein
MAGIVALNGDHPRVSFFKFFGEKKHALSGNQYSDEQHIGKDNGSPKPDRN